MNICVFAGVLIRVPGIYIRGKGGRWVGLTNLLLTSVDLLKSESLNLLGPSEPVQACNGIALPFASSKK